MLTLRDYQHDGVARISDAMRESRRVLYTLPTGGGKTVIFCHIAQQAATRNKQVMIVVHRQELVLQASSALAGQGLAHNIIAPKSVIRQAQCWNQQQHGHPYVYLENNICIASVQSVVRRLDRLDIVDLLILDEAHHAVSKSWYKVITAAVNAHVLGVTATPQRLDNKGLGDVFKALVEGPQIQNLIDAGHLCAPVLYAPPMPELNLDGVHTRAGDFKRDELSERVDKNTITGCAVKHYERYCFGEPAIAFCVSIEHAHHVAEQFSRNNYNAVALHGKTDRTTRRNAILGLGDGSVDVVCSCDLISEGVDVPVVSACLLLRPTQSLTIYLQQIGRCLRPAPGKSKAIVLDHAGNVHRHGFPTMAREWSLETSRRKPSNPRPLRTCPKCFAIHPPRPACPQCGFIYAAEPKDRTPEHADGELVELPVTADWAPNIDLRDRSKDRDIIAKARSIHDLLHVQKLRGYKNGWAWFQWKRIQERRRRKAG